MSGGSHDYICYKIDDLLAGKMFDPVLDELMNDISTLTHDFEWWQSADISEDAYRKTVEWFKKKWFTKEGYDSVLKKIIYDKIQEDMMFLKRLVEV